MNINGILNIYKDQGYTSHDVVAILRRILKTKKIGHTGTLDPNAQGVLPICIGQATKLSDLLMAKQKTYLASFALGKTTDTQDVWGQVLSQEEVRVSKREVEGAVLSFLGESLQIPPMYSALKHKGKKLYDLARQGQEVERHPRSITIYEIKDFRQLGPVEYQVQLTCSKGTYVRTLCHDIGQKLGCGAHMTALVRLQAGSFGLDSALKLGEVEDLQAKGQLAEKIIAIPDIFDLARVEVAEDFNRWLYAGNPIPLDKISSYRKTGDQIRQRLTGGDLVYVYNSQDQFMGIYRLDQDKLRVFKFLWQVSEG